MMRAFHFYVRGLALDVARRGELHPLSSGWTQTLANASSGNDVAVCELMCGVPKIRKGNIIPQGTVPTSTTVRIEINEPLHASLLTGYHGHRPGPPWIQKRRVPLAIVLEIAAGIVGS